MMQIVTLGNCPLRASAALYLVTCAGVLGTLALPAQASAAALPRSAGVPPTLVWSHPRPESTSQPHSAPAHRAASSHARQPSGQYVIATQNWAGIVDAGATFTGVGAQWTVPSVQPSQVFEASATWVGLDGTSAANPTIIQTGTTQATSSGQTSYFAWYELYPAASVVIGGVSPGDVMQAVISEVSPGLWTISIQDVTSAQSFSQNFAYSGPGASAEWIEEAPTVNGQIATLPNFGTVRFVNPGISGSNLAAASVFPIYMTDSGGQHVIAYPNNIDTSTGSFSVTYGSPPPPTVSSVSPGGGSTSGGTVVTISGTNLLSTVGVLFGITPATHVSLISDNQIQATAPPEAAGTVDVTVTTVGGTSAKSGPDVFTFTAPPPPPPPPPPHSGYDLVGSDGGVFVFPQGGGFYGSLPGLGVHVNNVVGMVPSPDDRGYFLVGSDGGVFAFGDAPFLGSLPGLGVRVNDIRGIVPTTDNKGYFLVGSDGGVFAFGDAPFLGSLPGRGIHRSDVIGISATPSDQGYWVVAADGTVYAFGTAPSLGSALGTPSPVASITSTPDGGGYWIATQNGGVYRFGDAGGFGSLTALGIAPSHPIIGLVPTADNQGYWLIGADGGIFAFGDAPYVGSLPGLGVSVTNIVGAVPTKV